MKRHFMKWLMALALPFSSLLAPVSAWAAVGPITCTTSNPTYNTAVYSPFATGKNITALAVTVTCNRTNTDATMLTYFIRPPAAAQQLASNTVTPAEKLNFDLYTDASCLNLWRNINPFTGTLIFNAGDTSKTASHAFYACINPGLVLTITGTFTDNVKLNLYNSTYGATNSTTPTQIDGNLAVSINVPAECLLTPAMPASLGTVDFGTYVAFGTGKTAQLNFKAKCTNITPYTMALTNGSGAPLTSGVLAGLNYTLALSAPTGAGNGADKTHTITGSMPAGQAGSCAAGGCAGQKSNTHYLTVTY